MLFRSCGLSVLVFFLTWTWGVADVSTTRHGGDFYVSGSGSVPEISAQRDVFAAGPSLALKGSAQGDLHAGGFDVDVETDVSGNVYAAGGTVTLRASIGEDLSAAGFSVRTADTAITAGNVRLAGGTVTIDGPVGGALTAAGGEVHLNAEVKGDVWLIGEDITFGPDAQILGSLRYAASRELSVPERVVAPDRVSFEKLDHSEMFDEMKDTWDKSNPVGKPSFLSVFMAFLMSLAFFIVIGAIFLSFVPKPIERMRKFSLDRPFLTVLTGIIGLSILFGMVPITALTIIGILFVPIAVLAIITVWILGYILGSYVVAMRLWFAFGGDQEPTLPMKLGVLAVGITLVALLNYIPFLGWIVNYTLVLLGVGAMTSAIFQRLSGGPLYANDVDLNPTET